MNESDKIIAQITVLVSYALDGALPETQAAHLRALLREHPDARDYYFKLLYLQTHLRKSANLSMLSETGYEGCLDMAFWRAMAEYERTAEPIDLPPAPVKTEPVTGVRQRRKQLQAEMRRPFPRFGFAVFFGGLAAFLMLVAYVMLNPKGVSEPVATLSDSLRAEWDGTSKSMQAGSRFYTHHGPVILRQGYAELLFDNDTLVTIEGPAKFQISAADQIKLTYGKVYANVPPHAYGFQINTPTARIIDLGTEFGVYQSIDNTHTELHVITGRAGLISGISGRRLNASIEGGSAARLNRLTGRLEDIRLDEALFARTIDSRKRIVYRGPKDDIPRVSDGTQVLLSEDFEDGTRNGWYLSSGGQVTVADDGGGIGSGKALFLEGDLPDFKRRILANFKPIELTNDGDSITLQFDFRITGHGDQYSGFRFGLFCSQGTAQSFDHICNRTTGQAANDTGFFVMQSVGNENAVRLVRERGETDSFMGGDDLSYHRTDELFGGIQHNQVHRVLFTITRNGDDLRLNYQLDDDRSLSANSSAESETKALYRFDQVGFAAKSSASSFAIDNVTVTFTPARPSAEISVQ